MQLMSYADKIKKCVVQCRVSTLKQSQDGESLETQEASLRNFIAEKGWQIVPQGRVWSTAISGRKTAREDFEEIMKFIKANKGSVDYYVFKAIDRFTRAGSGEYDKMKTELAQYGVEMIDTYGVIQASKNTLQEYGFEYEWSRYSPSEIAETIVATNAKQEITTILTRMIGQEIKLTNDGYKMRRPLDGFINQRVYVDGKKKPIQAPDPERAKYYIMIFEMRARGASTYKIIEKLSHVGFKTPFMNRWDKAHKKIIGRIGGKPMTDKQLHRVIQNPGYAGFICEKWTNHRLVKSRSPGLVSVETFNQANGGHLRIEKGQAGKFEFVRSTGKRQYLTTNPLFPYKFILCPYCKKELMGSVPRGKSGKGFPTYHCSRKHRYFGVTKKNLEENVQALLKGMKMGSDPKASIEVPMIRVYRAREKEVILSGKYIEENAERLRNEQVLRLEAIIATKSNVVREKLEQEYEAVEGRIKSATQKHEEHTITEKDIRIFREVVQNTMEHLPGMLEEPIDTLRKGMLFSLFFDKVPTFEEIRNGTPKTAWFVELSHEFAGGKNHLVSPEGLNWNTLENTISRWKSIFDTLGRPWRTSPETER